MTAFAIKSNKIVTHQGITGGYVLIENGLITAVKPVLDEHYPHPIVDAADSAVMPGVIDPHVHINEPGRTEWEGFDSATKAAISGGVTMLVDMPLNSDPVTTNIAAFEEKLACAFDKVSTNVGFWGGIVPLSQLDDIERLIENGVWGFKVFLTHSGIDEFPNVTEDDLRKVMPILAKYKLPLLVHCEMPVDNDELAKLQHPESYQVYLQSRPKELEDQAIELMINLCAAYQCHVHIVHLSSSNSITTIAEAKDRGLPLTVETGQHYLYFNAEDIADGNTPFKCAPPIRERANNDLLWKALDEGIIDFVATDHSPAPPNMKALDTGNFIKAWGGVSSIQFALPALWTAAKKRGFTLADIAKWLSENPAKLLSLQHKGMIAPGYDADLVIISEEQTFKVEEQMILHRHKITPYMNETLFGVVEQVFLKGEKVFDHGTIVPNQGKIMVKN